MTGEEERRAIAAMNKATAEMERTRQVVRQAMDEILRMLERDPDLRGHSALADLRQNLSAAAQSQP